MKRHSGDINPVYDFTSTLDELERNMSLPPFFKPRRKSNVSIRKKIRRSPFNYDHANISNRKRYTTLLSGSSSRSDPPSPPESPKAHYMCGPNKRRKTQVINCKDGDDTYSGDRYEIDFRRRDICVQMRLFKDLEDFGEDENALVWSSSEDESGSYVIDEELRDPDKY